MKLLAEYGMGKHTVKFMWHDEDGELCAVNYKAHTLNGVQKILRKFKRGLEKYKRDEQNFGKNLALVDSKTYGYKWLSQKAESCRITSITDDEVISYSCVF